MMEQWTLTNYGSPLDRAEDDYSHYDYHSTVAIRSEEHLRAALARVRRGGPVMLDLDSPSQASLEIGLGRELSGLRWQRSAPQLESKFALNLRPLTDKDHMFADGGGGTGFRPRSTCCRPRR
jgi:hypothetical protein